MPWTGIMLARWAGSNVQTMVAGAERIQSFTLTDRLEISGTPLHGPTAQWAS